MFQRMIDDFKESTRTALGQTSLAAAAALALLVTISFLCAAAFVAVLQTYGLIQACLAEAALFFVVALIAGGSYLVRRKQIKARAAEKEKTRSAVRTALADPMVVTLGLQVIRAVGVKRLIPILALGGLALGLLANRSPVRDEAPAE
jgi:archaellum biogenesis protein FlaJ (TadC family)